MIFKIKNIIYILLALCLFGLIGNRIYSIHLENQRQVFNIDRKNLKDGTPVEVLKIQKKLGFLREPIVIKNNRSYISSSRVNVFSVGQKVGDGKIIYVSNDIDLDSGMHIIKTLGVSDGIHYAYVKYNGFFIPTESIKQTYIMLYKNGIAVKSYIKIISQDFEKALISGDIKNDDLVIISKVDDKEKVRIKNK